MVRLLDQAVIRVARLRLEMRVAGKSRPPDATALTAEPDFFGGRSEPPADLEFSGAHDFTCASPMAGVALECRRIHGKFTGAGTNGGSGRW
jgi:hypothetical protein